MLSIVPNSAAVERTFSMFGIIHTKLRNQLHLEKVRMLLIVYADTASKHGHPLACHQKRHFSNPLVPPKDLSLPAVSTTPAVTVLTSKALASTLTTSTTPLGVDLVSSPNNANAANHTDKDTECPHPMDMTLKEALGSLEDDSEDIEATAPSTSESASTFPHMESLLLANMFDYPALPLVMNTSCRRAFDQYWKVGHHGLQIEEQAQEHAISWDGGGVRTRDS
jgi:hypothetical protein